MNKKSVCTRGLQKGLKWEIRKSPNCIVNKNQLVVQCNGKHDMLATTKWVNSPINEGIITRLANITN